jgi:IclR family transcriptional regulator, KDG regulon repressor
VHEGDGPVSSAAPKRVPAVQNALAILEFLRSVDNEPRTVSEIARGAGLNVSTCFNILKTLEDGLVIAFDPAQKTYRLGLRLAEFATLVDVRAQGAQLVLDEARRIADTVGLGCFLMGLDDRGEKAFVVLDKVESSNPIRVTIDRGARFPITGAVASKAWFAWSSGQEVRQMIERHHLTKHTERSITDTAEFEAELARTRQRGYSTSLGEYYPGHNAVAAPVFDVAGVPSFLLVVVGAASQLSDAELTRVGEEVAAGAERATKRIGGRHPQAPTDLESTGADGS